MKLSTTFAAVAEKFRVDFEQLAAEIDHRGQAGEARELALGGVLDKYLPERAAVDTGFVIDALGRQSQQMDIVIYDRTSTAVFDVSGKHFYPCETVLAVGQVKTAITSRERLTDALENIASVKALDRSNRGRNLPITGPGYSSEGVPFEPNERHRDQILGFIFTGSSMNQDTVIRQIQEWQAKHPRQLWPNVYCDFNEFLISYANPTGLITSVMDADHMYCSKPEEKPGLLLLLFTLLATFVGEAHTGRVRYFDYASIQETASDPYQLGEASN
jgi:hypothetical protein